MGPGSARPKQISHLPQLTSFRILLCSGCLGKERSDHSRYSDANCAWQKSLVTDAMTDVSVRTVTASKDANCGVSRQEQIRIHSRFACAAIGSVGTGLRTRWIGGSSFWSTPALSLSRSAVLSVMHIRGWMTESAMVPMRPGDATGDLEPLNGLQVRRSCRFSHLPGSSNAKGARAARN